MVDLRDHDPMPHPLPAVLVALLLAPAAGCYVFLDPPVVPDDGEPAADDDDATEPASDDDDATEPASDDDDATEPTSDDDDSASPEDPCQDAARQIFLLGRDDAELYSFLPSTGALTLIASLDCSIWGSPASMAVTRDGLGYVRYSDNELYEVDLFTGDCTPTSYVDDGFGAFGMGYAATVGSSTLDTLFVANEDTLAVLDTGTFQRTVVGPLPSQSELTGTGAGDLWAILPLETPPAAVRLDNTSGAPLQTVPVPGLPSPQDIDTFAFAHWGGSLWVFVRSYGLGNSTDVYQVDPAGILSTPWPDLGIDVVGAGVSTCAPLTQ